MSRHVKRSERERALHLASYYRVKAARTPEEAELARAKKRAYDAVYLQNTLAYQKERRKARYEANKESMKAQSAAARQRMRDNPELRARYNATVKARLDANGGVKGKEARAKQRLWRKQHAAHVKARQ